MNLLFWNLSCFQTLGFTFLFCYNFARRNMKKEYISNFFLFLFFYLFVQIHEVREKFCYMHIACCNQGRVFGVSVTWEQYIFVRYSHPTLLSYIEFNPSILLRVLPFNSVCFLVLHVSHSPFIVSVICLSTLYLHIINFLSSQIKARKCDICLLVPGLFHLR